LGATFDPSGLYRQRAVFDWLREEGVTVEAIHSHVVALQERFLHALREQRFRPLLEARLVTPVDTKLRGHFLTFATPRAPGLHDELLKARIVTDVRGDRIRFGFGCYHGAADIDRAVQRMSEAVLEAVA
jgi:kynureninase